MLPDHAHRRGSCKNLVQIFLPAEDGAAVEVLARQSEHVKQPHLQMSRAEQDFDVTDTLMQSIREIFVFQTRLQSFPHEKFIFRPAIIKKRDNNNIFRTKLQREHGHRAKS